jgi:hypothetical protein
MRMDIIELITFEEFEKEVTNLLEDLKRKHAERSFSVSPLLFRGQSSNCWPLKTTIERYSSRQYSLKDYWNIMKRIKPSVQSHIGRAWDFKDEYTEQEDPRQPQGYDFMVYLRHQGFPSPLLDWTRSPYVAAFFAFQSIPTDEKDKVAIYSFIEYYEGLKIGSIGEATIIGCEPYVTTHQRHFSQQSEYTYCWKSVNGKKVYCGHEEALQRNDPRQDVLKKFVIPVSERTKFLEKLSLMNITAYSLFRNEESLLASLAYQEIEKGSH